MSVVVKCLNDYDSIPQCDKWVLGLDVSTTAVGRALIGVNKSECTGDIILTIKTLDAVTFKGCGTLWDKADVMRSSLQSLSRVDVFCIEEALMGFKPGLSSAATISTLMKFNGIVSYIARDVFETNPNFLMSQEARKASGVKLQQPKKVNKNHKQQVFEHMSANDLLGYEWPKKKSGKIVDWAADATDAYVIAKAYVMLNMI